MEVLTISHRPSCWFIEQLTASYTIALSFILFSLIQSHWSEQLLAVFKQDAVPEAAQLKLLFKFSMNLS